LESGALAVGSGAAFDLPPLQRAFEATLFTLEQALTRQAELDKEIEALAETEPYREPVGWLRCFRGIDTLSAMILLAEVIDFQRSPGPANLWRTSGWCPASPPRAIANAAGR
jgi:hypothetical protein